MGDDRQGELAEDVEWTQTEGGAALRWQCGARSLVVDVSATFRSPDDPWVLPLRAADLCWADGAPLMADERSALHRAIERRGAPTDWEWLEDD
jgi:hypothetical protein